MSTKKTDTPPPAPPVARERKLSIKEKEALVEMMRAQLHPEITAIEAAEARLKSEVEDEVKAEWEIDKILAERDRLARQLAETDRKIADWFGDHMVPSYNYKLNSHHYNRDRPKFELEVNRRMDERNGAIGQMRAELNRSAREIYLSDLGPGTQAIFERLEQFCVNLRLAAEKKAPEKKIGRQKPKI